MIGARIEKSSGQSSEFSRGHRFNHALLGLNNGYESLQVQASSAARTLKIVAIMAELLESNIWEICLVGSFLTNQKPECVNPVI